MAIEDPVSEIRKLTYLLNYCPLRCLVAHRAAISKVTSQMRGDWPVGYLHNITYPLMKG